MGVLKQGDGVEVLDDNIKGTVKQISANVITVETDDGFLLDFEASQLVKIEGRLEVTNYDVAKIRDSKEIPKRKSLKAIRPKERNVPKFEVDLHIGQLVPSSRGMSNFDILNLQLDTAKRQLEFAIKKRIQKVVFIHGVGEGVLKEELKYLFKRYPVDFYDADYRKYGLGATEVYIYQNG